MSDISADVSATVARLCYPHNQPNHPCNLAEHIESVCFRSKLTKPKEQQECFCSEYFEAWQGCVACKRENGLYKDDYAGNKSIAIGEASKALCDGPAPTVHYLQVFESVGRKLPLFGEAITVAEFVASTPVPVSEYYTAASDVTQVTPPGTMDGEIGDDGIFTPGMWFSVPTKTPAEPPAPKETGKNDTGKGDGDEKAGDDNKDKGDQKEGSAASPKVNAWTALALANVLLFALVH